MKKLLNRMKRNVRYAWNRGERQQLLQDEMQFHIEEIAGRLMDGGMSYEEAIVAARRKFGNMTRQMEESRETWISRWWNDGLQDVRYALRTLRRDVGFTVFAILIVGLGVGASATVFSVINALLLRPLPVSDPASLVWIGNGNGPGLSAQTVQVSHLLDLRRQNQSFSDVAAYFAFYGVGDSRLSGDGEPERLSGVPVSQNFFPLLGVQPQLGRSFSAEECKWNGPKVVMLGNGIWKRRFASDAHIIGKKLVLNDEPVTVVGVLPPSFDFATMFAPASRIDLYFPFPLTPETDRWGNTIALIGRLKPGATVQSAGAELKVLGSQITRLHPERNEFRPNASLLQERITGRFRSALLVLACAVGVVMLIVCANLSNLQLSRMAARQKELSIRTALGAGRYRLIRQMLTENVLLSAAGATLGVALAVFGTRALSHLQGVSIPLLETVHVDSTALVFALLSAVGTGILFGLAPALQAPGLSIQEALKETSRGSTHGGRHAWLRNALVVSEIAFAGVLLVGAGLLARSFLQVLDVNLGFHPERAATVRIDPNSKYATQAERNTYFNEALRRVRETPGILAAGLTDSLPLGRNRSWGAGAKGQTYEKGKYPIAYVRIISDGYFKAMGIPVKSGREFTERDEPGTQKVAIINETLARTLWPGQDPIGKQLEQGGGSTVVGVVGDVRHLALEQTSGSEMYFPIRQTGDYQSVDLVVRTALPSAELAPAVRAALRPIEPNLPGNEFRTLQQLVDKAVSPRRFIVLLLSGFSAFALLLASLGIYGVISYSVEQRVQEIGIRMALGASALDLQGRIVLQTLTLAAIGMGIGLVTSWALARSLGSLLYGVESTDPLTFLGMSATLIAVAALAGYLPALRASRIDPMSALRTS